MKRKSILGRCLPAVLILVAIAAQCIESQCDEDPARTALIKSIEERAQRDVKLGNAPAGIERLNLIFGEKARESGVPLLELLSRYEDAYQKAKPAPGWWESLAPKVGWFAAAATFVLGVLAALLKDSLTKLVLGWRENVYRRLAGHRLLRRNALRHYRKALIDKYQKIKIPFRPDQPLDMRELYVPMKVVGSNDIDQIGAEKSIAEFRRLMVVGAPGSGKSMLLKSIALAHAEERLSEVPGNPIPILLELNRLNDSQDSLDAHLVKVLELNDFPHAENFVKAGLAKGRLLLMFDGLDEVNIQRRAPVVKEIEDLLDRYEDCRAVITCRNAVYNQEFVHTVDATLEIVEFNDQQIERFLGAWKEKMRGDRSVEQLMHTLRDRPRIMALARNPLLLTVIAYMYTDTDFTLPHNRAGFYEQSTNVLLGIWKQSANKYRDVHKRLVLQHLALFNQDRRGESGPGGRSIDLPTALVEVKKVLPDLNIPVDQAGSVLEEIVERSGLLLSIDGGSQYQFAHLTIQEFFAAVALQDDQVGLFQRFRSDAGAWRETLMLWCGLGRDSSSLITDVMELDPVTAFECLADAQKVKPEVADAIVSKFESLLIESSELEEAILRGFAAVAADARPRGVKTFEFLREALVSAESQGRHRAAGALAFTNLPRAAQALAEHFASNDWIRPNLVRMGDLAVPSLASIAAEGSIEAVDGLYTVGTHEAVKQLVNLLWLNTTVVNIRAAWRLGGMLTKSEFQDILRSIPIPDSSRIGGRLDWIWPAEAATAPALPIIAGRIGYLLQQAPIGSAPETSVGLSPLLLVPLLVGHQRAMWVRIEDFVYREVKATFKTRDPTIFKAIHEWQLEQFGDLDDESSSGIDDESSSGMGLGQLLRSFVEPNTERFAKFLDESKVEKIKAVVTEELLSSFREESWSQLVSQAPKQDQFRLLMQFYGMRLEPSPADWKSAWQPVTYAFESGWHYLSICVILTVASLLALFELSNMVMETWANRNVVTWAVVGLGAAVVVSLINFWTNRAFYGGRDNPDEFVPFVLLGPVIVPLNIFDDIRYPWRRQMMWRYFSSYVSHAVWSPTVVVFLSLFLLRFAEWPLAVAIWLGLLAIGSALWLRGQWRERLARNPLREIVKGFRLGEVDLGITPAKEVASAFVDKSKLSIRHGHT